MIILAGVFFGVLSIYNKVTLFLGQKSGWFSGMAIGLLSGFYFWAIGLKILAIAEFGFFIVMLYGYVRHVHPSKERMLQINIVMSILTLLLCYFLFTGYLTLIETISSLSFIWGGYLISTAHKSLGWFFFITAHVATGAAAFFAGQVVFAGLQMVSGLVSVYAFLQMLLRKD